MRPILKHYLCALALIWAVALALPVGAAQEKLQPAEGNVPAVIPGISAATVGTLAPWQQRLTVGPGDTLDISLYGQADSARPGVIIGPDGRLNYLQATDVMATGLTVDELRTRLEDVLKEFHHSPRVVIVPVAFQSKKYFVLGNVAQRGVFTLDRPVSIVEAVARAHGFVVGTQQRSSFTLADFSRAFLVRRAGDGSYSREPVDFEALFARGELQHNKLLAPDDYLYFPPLGLEEVYTLGEVKAPGVVPYTKDLTVLGTIAARGGFTEGAYRQRILVVRGSLDHPETFVVNVSKGLRGLSPDFRLQPRDIVYVSRKPWAKAEELLKAASSDFIRALVVTWTGEQVGVLIK